jgi:hypothetical protein
MKKIFLIGMVLVLAVSGVVFAGSAYAQTADPQSEITETPVCPMGNPMGSQYRQSMRGGAGAMMRAGGTGAMMAGEGTGLLSGYVHDALADALGLTPEELTERVANGETAWDIAQEQGLTFEQFQELKWEAHTAAIEQAVADGVITPEQAELMLSRIQQHLENGFGAGAGVRQGRGMRGNGFGNSR